MRESTDTAEVIDESPRCVKIFKVWRYPRYLRNRCRAVRDALRRWRAARRQDEQPPKADALAGRRAEAGHVLVDAWNGLLIVSCKDVGVGLPMLETGEWEKDLLARAMHLLSDRGYVRPERDVVIDAGANIGVTAIALLRHFHFTHAVAIEPEIRNVELLTANLYLNSLQDAVTTIRCALSDEDGEATLELSDENLGDHRVRVTDGTSADFGTALYRETTRNVVVVPRRRLDSLCREDLRPLVGRIGLLWVDAQGHEGHLLRGAGELLRQNPIPVVSEFWPYGIRRSGMSQAEFAAIVKDFFSGFTVVSDEQPKEHDIEEIDMMFARLVDDEDATLLFWPKAANTQTQAVKG